MDNCCSISWIHNTLAVVASKSEENKMTAPKLAALFRPGILVSPNEILSGADVQILQDVLVFLIENLDDLTP